MKPKEKSLLPKLWSSGMGSGEIAKLLRVDQRTITRWCRQLGLEPQRGGRPRHEERRAKFAQMWRAGVSYTEIMRILGMKSKSLVTTWRNDAGLPKRKPWGGK